MKYGCLIACALGLGRIILIAIVLMAIAIAHAQGVLGGSPARAPIRTLERQHPIETR